MLCRQRCRRLLTGRRHSRRVLRNLAPLCHPPRSVGPVGFEPTTFGLKVRCSARLSHGPDDSVRQLDETDQRFPSFIPRFLSVTLM